MKYPVKGTDTVREATENDVVYKGEIVGSDPDAGVRSQILREAQAGDNGGDGGGA